MNKPILVTGPTGNVGTQLVQQLAEAKIPVRAGVRSLKRVEPIPGVDFVELDLNKAATIQASFSGVEKVFLLTPLVEEMVQMTAYFVDAAKQAGVKHIVRLSGMGADAKPAIPLGQLHRQAEEAIEASGIAYTFLRPNSFYQNYLGPVANSIKNENAFYFPLGDGKVSYVDTRDVAAVAVAVLTQSGHENKAYDITGPQGISNDEVAAIFSSVLAREIKYVPVSDEQAKEGMQQAGLSEWLIDIVLGLYGIQKTGAWAGVSPTVEQITGKQAISFEQFVKDYAQEFQ